MIVVRNIGWCFVTVIMAQVFAHVQVWHESLAGWAYFASTPLAFGSFLLAAESCRRWRAVLEL